MTRSLPDGRRPECGVGWLWAARGGEAGLGRGRAAAGRVGAGRDRKGAWSGGHWEEGRREGRGLRARERTPAMKGDAGWIIRLAGRPDAASIPSSARTDLRARLPPRKGRAGWLYHGRTLHVQSRSSKTYARAHTHTQTTPHSHTCARGVGWGGAGGKGGERYKADRQTGGQAHREIRTSSNTGG